jgi:tryptophanyl-tRNA synthetase
MNQTCLTGIKPTGNPHLGNYFGLMRPMLDLAHNSRFDEMLIFVANLHALNSVSDAQLLRQYTNEIIVSYLAIGLDPAQVTLFLQSDIRELTELTWIFNNLVTVAYLERSHAYKDAIANGKEANMGLFDYPVLMAADILMYNSTIVPVGQDQKQHIEIAQKIADKFNARYGDIFIRPKPLIQSDIAVIKGLDGRKMSKSYHNTIELFETDEQIRSKVSKIITDSKGPTEPKDPDECNIMALYKLIASEEEITKLSQAYREGSISYREAKELLAESLIDIITPLRNKREELLLQPEYIQDILSQGAEKARAIAQAKMKKVREAVGI